MKFSPELEKIARERVERSHGQTMNSLQSIANGNPLAAEPDSQRLLARLQTKALLSRDEAEAIAVGIRAVQGMSAQQRESLAGGPEAIQGRTIDFVGVSFLERGLKAARAVARVAFRDGRPQGSGFMVSDRLFLTNKHVLETAASAGVWASPPRTTVA